MNSDHFNHSDSDLANIIRRIELLKRSDSISLEDKIRIAELVLSILEEEKTKEILQ